MRFYATNAMREQIRANRTRRREMGAHSGDEMENRTATRMMRNENLRLFVGNLTRFWYFLCGIRPPSSSLSLSANRIATGGFAFALSV